MTKPSFEVGYPRHAETSGAIAQLKMPACWRVESFASEGAGLTRTCPAVGSYSRAQARHLEFEEDCEGGTKCMCVNDKCLVFMCFRCVRIA